MFVIDGWASLRLAASDEAKKKPSTFEMVANSGKPILGHWFWDNLGIDLSGVKTKQRMPVLKDHDTDQRIGFSTDVEMTKDGMVVRGELLASSVLAQQIQTESREGFPWQASVHLRPLKIERIPEGETAEVNGHVMAGPGHVFRSCECREVSFTALGADSETSASAFSGASPGEIEVEVTEAEETEEMSETKPVPAAQPPAPTIEAARAEASSAALTAERNRAAAILAAAAPEQAQLAQQLVSDGAALVDALTKLNADIRQRNQELRTQLAAKPVGDAPLSNGNAPNQQPQKTPLELAMAMPEGPEKAAKLFELDPALRAEFASKESYLAYAAAVLRTPLRGKTA